MFYSVFANPAIDTNAIFEEIDENDLEIYNLLPSLISSIKHLKKVCLKKKNENLKTKPQEISKLDHFWKKFLYIQSDSRFKKELKNTFLSLKNNKQEKYIDFTKNIYIFNKKYLIEIKNEFDTFENYINELNLKNKINEIFHDIKIIIDRNFELLKLINKKLQISDELIFNVSNKNDNSTIFLGNKIKPILEKSIDNKKNIVQSKKKRIKDIERELIKKENDLLNLSNESNKLKQEDIKLQEKHAELSEILKNLSIKNNNTVEKTFSTNILKNENQETEDEKIIIEYNNTIDFNPNNDDLNDDDQTIEDENYDEKWWLQFENKKNKKYTDLKSVYIQKNEQENKKITVTDQILGKYVTKTKIHQDNLLERIIVPGKNKIKELNWESQVKPLIEELGGCVEKSSKGFVVRLNTIKTFFHTHGKIYKDTINDHLKNFLISALS